MGKGSLCWISNQRNLSEIEWETWVLFLRETFYSLNGVCGLWSFQLSRRNGFTETSFLKERLLRKESDLNALIFWPWVSHRNYRFKKNNAEALGDGPVFKNAWCSYSHWHPYQVGNNSLWLQVQRILWSP